MADDQERAELMVSEVHKRINNAFEVFDHDLNKTVDVREIGAIVRSLGCFPTEAELLDIIDEVLDQQKKGYLEPEELTKYMTQGDEPFTQEEMEEMLSSAVDPNSNVVYYKDFVNMMLLD
ncbi:hypothetical protein CRUP_022330, partial [Coryphaenoides rupestris]